jgi:hypothetical protein
MGLIKGMSFADPAQIRAAVDKAQDAWDAGKRCYIFRSMAMSILKPEGLNDAVDAMLRMGWDLHSTALVFNTTGLNSEQAMFTFLRPSAN